MKQGNRARLERGWWFVIDIRLWRRLCLLCPVLLTACHHTNPYYADTPALPSASISGAGKDSTALSPVALDDQLDPAWLKPPSQLFTLGPGDKIEIEVLGDPGSRVTTVVGPDGKIYFNLLTGIDVWGLTLVEAKQRLEAELSKYVRQPPQVSLVLRGVESKRVWVLGRVQTPGVYPIAAPMTLLEAISMAGGTLSLSSFREQSAAGMAEELADLRRSFVLRQGKMLPLDFYRLLNEGDITQNIYLQPDDLVYLPAATAREVYVLGAVAQPRMVPYTEDLTVAGAIASAYGTVNGAYMHHVAVVRGSLQNPQMAIVDYKRVIRGEATDIQLQPHDIVYVPFSPYRYLQKYAELILNTFVAASAINAGINLIPEKRLGGTGVFIPVGSGVQVLPPVAPPPIR
jgi:protein involved in polysaccharide export with SLBB domain